MRIISCGLIAAVTITTAARSEDWTESQRSDVVSAGVKYGLTTVRAMAVSMDTALPPPTADVTAVQRQALEKVLKGYVETRANAQGSMMALKGGADFLVDTTAVTMAATGVGMVPAAVFKATAQVASDALFTGMQNDINQNLELYLKKREPELLAIAGGDYNKLRAESPAALKAKLDQQATIFAEINNMVGSDPVARERARDMVIQAIRNTSKATLDAIDKQDARLTNVESRVGNLANSVARFERQTLSVLESHEKALVGLRDDMTAMQSAVSSIDQRLRTQERNATVVNDFVFDAMPPGAKAAALKGGFLAERFACPQNTASCGGPELKEDLIKRFEAEARIANRVEAVKTTVVAMANVATIANNLGINIPGLNDAVQYGTAAANAFASFSTGNYLGAIASVTGAFRKQVDPDAERFKILMGYLQEQFKVVNAKLDAILENQKKMMEALTQLSEQMRTYYVALDERLIRMEFELKRTRDIGLTNLWQPWTACEAVYNHITRNEQKYRYLANSDFARIDDLYAAIGTIGQPAADCVKLGQTRPITITSPQWFGNFLDVRFVKEETPDPLPPDEAAKGEILSRVQLDAFISGVHSPSQLVLIDLLNRSDMPLDRGIEMLLSPGYFVRDVRKRLQQKPNGVPCGSTGYLQERVQRLLCGAGTPANNAATLIGTPMAVDTALKVTEWLLAASRFADLIDQSNGTYVPQTKLMAHARATENSISPGLDILEKTQSMLDAAVTGYSVLYGDLTARAIVDTIFAPPPSTTAEAGKRAEVTKPAISLLRKNPFLAGNVAMIYLHDRYRAQNNTAESARPSLLRYRTAFDAALQSTSDPAFLLRGVFGDDLVFEVDASKSRIVLNLTGKQSEVETVKIPIPEPQTFVEGRLIYPARMTALMTARARVAERIADYHATSGLTAAERKALISAVARAEYLNPDKPTRAENVVR